MKREGILFNRTRAREGKKGLREHAQIQMYVLKKNTTLIEKEKKHSILSDGMVMYVNERSPYIFFSPSLFLIALLSRPHQMYIIISCFVRQRKREERKRKKRIVLFLAIGEYALFFLLSFFFGSLENRTEKEKTQLIGGIYRFEKFAGHVRQGSSKEKEKNK